MKREMESALRTFKKRVCTACLGIVSFCKGLGYQLLRRVHGLWS